MTDLKSHDLPELEALAEQIKAEIARREQEEADKARAEAEAAEAARKAAEEEALRKKAEAAAHEEAVREAARKAAEAAAARKAAVSARAAAPAPAATPAPASQVRYMHPSNRALTWDGQGLKPDWIQAWLTTGGTLYALEIAAEKLAPRPIPESFLKR